jgi:hypothetical protein
VALTNDEKLYAAGGVAIVLGIVWWLRKKGGQGTDAAAAPGDMPTQSFDQAQYPPNDQSTVDLFTAAAAYAGLPTEWAVSNGLNMILAKESLGGWVGIPNYQFGQGSTNAERATWLMNNQDQWPVIWDAIRSDTWRDLLDDPFRNGPRKNQSSATGLGQLTSTNIKSGKYYPSNLDGIGVPLEEAIGMLKYIAENYGDPDSAWAQYGAGHEGY